MQGALPMPGQLFAEIEKCRRYSEGEDEKLCIGSFHGGGELRGVSST